MDQDLNELQLVASDALRHMNHAEYGSAVEVILTLDKPQAVYVALLLMDGLRKPYAAAMIAAARERR